MAKDSSLSRIWERYSPADSFRFLLEMCARTRSAAFIASRRFFRQLRDDSQLGGKCGACEFRHICGGSRARAYALTGDPLAEEPCCSYMPKNYVGTETPPQQWHSPAALHVL